MAGEIDLQAYLDRIGHRGPTDPTVATLQALVLEHLSAIPFESLNPLLGRPVRLDGASLQAKLVAGRRGGYCFEQNGLFARVLEALGFQVTPMAARVRWMLPDDAPQTALTHMLLKVDLAQGPFLADVGFGGQSPSAPLRLERGVEQPTGHGLYRLEGEGRDWELQMRLPGRWQAMYRFRDEAQGPLDYEVANWFTSTHPASRFTNNLVASRIDGERRLNLFNSELTVHWPDGRTDQRILAGPGEAAAALAGEFGLAVEPADMEGLWPRLPGPATG